MLYNIGIFIDLSKAFDTIEHGKLLNKWTMDMNKNGVGHLWKYL